MRLSLRVVLVGILASSVFALPVRAHSCASTAVSLSEYLRSGASPFYLVEEGDQGRFVLARLGHECDPNKVAQVSYSTPEGGTALESADYNSTSGTVEMGVPSHTEPVEKQGFVPTLEDGITENLESVRVHIDEVVGAGIGLREVPMYLVDDDGEQRFSFAPVPLTQSEGLSQASVHVIREGPLSGGDITVAYSLTEGTASQGADYTATATGSLTFSGSERAKTISFSIVNDTKAEGNEELTVAVSPATGGEISTSFNIVDNEENSPPDSRLHHPKHGVVYDADDDYLLREIHVFTSDDTLTYGESGVARAQLALRRKMKSGACKWWSGAGFKAGPCNQKVWKRMRSYNQDFYYLRFPKFAASAGTKIKNYAAYSRAIDLADNVETDLRQGRNANTFEIDRR